MSSQSPSLIIHISHNHTLHICAQRGVRERESVCVGDPCSSQGLLAWPVRGPSNDKDGSQVEIPSLEKAADGDRGCHIWQEENEETMETVDPSSSCLHGDSSAECSAALEQDCREFAGDVPDGMAKHMVVMVMDHPKPPSIVLYIFLFLPSPTVSPCRTQSQTSTS